MKTPARSKTVWINVAVMAQSLSTVLLCVKNETYDCDLSGALTLFMLALTNLVLRFFTKEKIKVKKDIHTIMLCLLLLPILACCSKPDIRIPDDPYPVPIKTGYNTLAFRTVCDGHRNKITDFGHSGCSVAFGSDPANTSVTLLSPFDATVTIESFETKYKERFILQKGKFRTFTLEDLELPLQTEFATFTFTTQWQKPEKVKIEGDIYGQRGQFHYRLRPKNRAPAVLNWAPDKYKKDHIGIAYGQFQGLAPQSTGLKPFGEPMLLKIYTTDIVPDGRYRLYNSAKDIGVQTSEFAGDEILVSTDSILGPHSMDSYTLFGWARDKDLSVDNDFVVSINQYRYDTQKLAAELVFKEDELCYLTENVVFLIALTSLSGEFKDVAHGIDDYEDGKCFKSPRGEAEMFFLTGTGRSAIIWLNGTTGEYEVYN